MLGDRNKAGEEETRRDGAQVTKREKVRREVKRKKRGISDYRGGGREEESSCSSLCFSVAGELSLWVVLTDGIPDLWFNNHYPLSQLGNVYTNIQGQRQGETRYSDVSMIYCTEAVLKATCMLVSGKIMNLQTHIRNYLSSFHVRRVGTNKENNNCASMVRLENVCGWCTARPQ